LYFESRGLSTEIIPVIKNTYTYEYKKQPYACPVCQGRGTVRCGFYTHGEYFASSNTAPEVCKSCKGSGIIWS